MQRAEQPAGLACRACGCRHFRVRNTIPTRDGRIKRYRLCRHCGQVLTTYEGTAGRRNPAR